MASSRGSTGPDDTGFQNSWDEIHLRSDGTILSTDLRGEQPRGRFVPETAIHDCSGAISRGPAVWEGSVRLGVGDGTTMG